MGTCGEAAGGPRALERSTVPRGRCRASQSSGFRTSSAARLGFEGAAHTLRVACDGSEIGTCGLVGLRTALLPVAHGSERDMVAGGKLFCVSARARRNVLMRGTLRARRNSSSVIDCASGSRRAASEISSSVIGASGPGSGTGISVPSGITRRNVPSRCILTIISVLLMSFRPASRDYPDIVSALRVRNVQHLAPIQAKQAEPLLR